MTAYVRDVVMKVTPHGRFALATKALPSRVLHLVTSAHAVWTRDWRQRPLRFQRITGDMACGRRVLSVTIHRLPPAEFELCNYCLMAELGIEPGTAPKLLAAVGAEELDRIERALGVPVSRAVRLARIAGVAS